MGLDQYLYARTIAVKGSAIADLVERHLNEAERKQLDTIYDDGSGGEAYVSGWQFRDEDQRSELYKALCVAFVTPHSGSPSFSVRRKDGGYEIDSTVMYWRKVNAVHKWFVDHVQDGVDECQESPVHPESLMDLLERAEVITADHAKSHDLLPTQGGFFFGSTEYDEYYFEDVKETAVELKAQIAMCPPGTKFYYQASW